MTVTGAEVNEACRTEKLCGEWEFGIEGVNNAVRLLWQQHVQEGGWGFIGIDACNAFNE